MQLGRISAFTIEQQLEDQLFGLMAVRLPNKHHYGQGDHTMPTNNQGVCDESYQ